MKRTFEEINEKIRNGKVKVLTAQEAKILAEEKGIDYILNNIDVVVCATFEMNVNALVYLSFGQTDPLIYFQDATINSVPCCPLGPTDLALSSVATSRDNYEYSGANVLEELVSKKDVYLRCTGKRLEVFPNKEFETWFNLRFLNQARLLLNQCINQNGIVATNSSDKDINSHMGTLISHVENATFNSSSYLNPLINDPFCKTIGIGTKVWVSGADGVIVGEGSNHNPLQKRNECGIPVGPAITLSCMVDIKMMKPKYLRAGFIKSYGPVLFVGVGVPIPVLDEEIAEHLTINDEKIHTTIVDFSIPRRTKPTFGQCTYKELRTSTVIINKKPTLVAPLSSMAWAIDICNILKEEIINKNFYLNKPVISIPMDVGLKKLDPALRELV